MSASAAGLRHCLVFRDKLLLPSEGFIKSHYEGFDALCPAFVANRFGWCEAELNGAKYGTARGLLGQFLFKQTGRMDLTDLRALNALSLHAHFGRGGALALPIAKALNLPLYVTFHGGDATKNTHRRRRLIPTIYQRRLADLQTYARGFLCVSQFVAQRLQDQGFPADKLITHYIGIDCTHLQPPRRRDGRLLFIGRLVGKKGVDILLAALRQMQASGQTVPGVDIAGSGPMEASLRQMAADLPQVRFLGWQTPPQLARHLAECSAVIVPSREADDGDCEGLPTVVLEAIRAGAPVIATRHAGIPEIIDDGITGLLAVENDVGALAELLNQADAMREDLPQMAVAAQTRLRQDFNAKDQSKRLQEYLMA